MLKLAKFESYIELFQLKVLKLAKLKLYWIVSAKNVENEKNCKILKVIIIGYFHAEIIKSDFGLF